jgi:Pup amidohydrolase
MVSSICGLETEYGLSCGGLTEISQLEAALDFFASCKLPGAVPWDLSRESPGMDARDNRAEASVAPSPSSLADGFMLPNGARFYVDHGHPEYCTPECRTPADLVASDMSGELLLDRCRAEYSQGRDTGRPDQPGALSLFKNNSDHKGNSYGCHENYLLTGGLYEELFRHGSKLLPSCLVPFLVSRVVICGSGKVGTECGLPAVDYQISQRADFIETLIGLQTTWRRPLINTRDEPHADRSKHRRLHVISGDSNMAEWSTYLKAGCTLALLAMLEDGVALPDQTLFDPITALRTFSRDPACRAEAELQTGIRRRAIDIQSEIADCAESWAGRPGIPEWMREVVRNWSAVLDALRRDPMELRDRLDWVIKLHFLQEWRRKRGVGWEDPRLTELEIRYHDISPQRSVYHLLRRTGRVRRIVADETVVQAAITALPGTRARLRSDTMRDQKAISATWSCITTAEGKTLSFPEEYGLCDG